jgi:hypothetical protein
MAECLQPASGKGVVLTNGRGAFSDSLGEYALAGLCVCVFFFGHFLNDEGVSYS